MLGLVSDAPMTLVHIKYSELVMKLIIDCDDKEIIPAKMIKFSGYNKI